jgi:predicted SpoU family rRNA methylase
MKKLFLVVTLVLLSAAFLSADIYIKQETKTGAFMGQAAKDIVQEQWFGNNRIATITQDNSFIINMAEKKFYMINHKSKTYVESTLPLDIAKLMPDQMAGMMKAMMEGMTVSVQANGQSKKVGNWNTKGYDVNITMMGMNMKMVFWASTDVPFDWKKLALLSGELYKAQMRLGEKFVEEFKKIEGYPVASDMEMMGMKVSMVTSEISEKTPSANIYTPPAGYTKKDKFGMEDMKQ